MNTQSSAASTMYRTQTINARRWVWQDENIIGALSYNKVRAHVFPLFTPAGVQVLQEAAADHLHHQGIMVGQDALNGENFWAMLNPGSPCNRQELVNEACEMTDNDVAFTLMLDWMTADHRPVVREQRLVRFAHHEDCNEVLVRSELIAQFGPVNFGATKEGGIGMRVHPLLETPLGGCILDSEGRAGEESVFDHKADWINVGGKIGNAPAGILMAPDASEERIPWFVRDYGLHLHSPRRHTPLQLAEGESTRSAVRFLAHDGLSEVEALNQMLRRVLDGESHE